ncbi:MAG: ankyrin repeat domain-containing protein, partial [Chloroflexi bacterium]|nr:ankyrin repeat domain-containing protein [Chloroflexota bacterium]
RATPPSEARLAIARFLLAAGADIHQDGDGPLMRACLNDGRIPMVELLVEAGANVNAFWRGTYPILWAPCETLAPRVIAWLLAHGADPNTANPEAPEAGTPLDMVVGTYSRSPQQQECAELLITAGGRCRFDGLPSLEIHRGRLDLLEERIRADLGLVHRRFPEFDYGSTAQSALTLKGSTLLHVAASYGDVEAARLLLDAGADPNAPAMVDDNGVGRQTALFHAVAQYFDYGVPVARLLIERGASLSVRARVPGRYDQPDESLEVTPLGFAVRFPHEPVRCTGAEKLLMEWGAPAGDVYAAARLGLADELSALLSAGGDPNMKNLDGESALQAATDRSHQVVCRLLRAAGAAGAS